jgi:electron transport complex protein RnfG
VNYRQVVITTIILLLFALIGTTLVVFTFDNTRERIAANERATLLRKLHQLITPERHDNVLLEDTLLVTDRTLLGTSKPVTVYRARKAAQPVALVITPVAPDGYSGSIKLLVGINVDGTLSGVRVVAHWIHVFDNRSLGDPPLERWGVKKDGGDFDQLTGATITPRALVKAVRQALLYYRDNQEALFASNETSTPAPGESDD